MEPTPPAAPGHNLPPIKSSTLHVNARAMARAVTAHANEAREPKVVNPSPPVVSVEETTLGALTERIKGAAVEENAFDPREYVRRTGAQTPRRTGAGLAAAALKKLGG